MHSNLLIVGGNVAYRNKTYVAFASEDIGKYRLMEAWRENEHIDFDFFDAHDLYISRDDSNPETIKRYLRERLKNAKHIVLLGSRDGKAKGGDGESFLAHEMDIILEFNLPVVIANLDGGRTVNNAFIPTPLAEHFSVCVSFQSKIIMHALDGYVAEFAKGEKRGPHQYPANVYKDLGL